LFWQLAGSSNLSAAEGYAAVDMEI
jgi:hypothetical protein